MSMFTSWLDWQWPWGNDGEDHEDRRFERQALRRLKHTAFQNDIIIWQNNQILNQEKKNMGATEDLKAAVQALQDVDTGLDQAVTRVDAWVEAHPDVDTTELNAAVADLKTHAANVEALTPDAVVTPDPGTGDTGTPFVVKIDGESYSDYAARAQAAGLTPGDEATWDALPVG